MNIVIYVLLWTFIGLLAGFIASWLSDNGGYNWFFANLSVGFVGAVFFGYFFPLWLFGLHVVQSAYSLLFALFGAAVSLLLLALFGFLLRR